MKKNKRCFFCKQLIRQGQPFTISPDGKTVLHDVCVIRLIHDYKGKEELEKN